MTWDCDNDPPPPADDSLRRAAELSSRATRDSLIETFSRWSRQRHTDDNETPIDDYGKRILSMVIREIQAGGVQ